MLVIFSKQKNKTKEKRHNDSPCNFYRKINKNYLINEYFFKQFLQHFVLIS